MTPITSEAIAKYIATSWLSIFFVITHSLSPSCPTLWASSISHLCCFRKPSATKRAFFCLKHQRCDILLAHSEGPEGDKLWVMTKNNIEPRSGDIFCDCPVMTPVMVIF